MKEKRGRLTNEDLSRDGVADEFSERGGFFRHGATASCAPSSRLLRVAVWMMWDVGAVLTYVVDD